jgi:Trypsin-co-occurring domain 2
VLIAEGEGESLRFKPGPIELEQQLEIGREGGGSAGIKWFVVSASGQGKVTRAATHTVKVTLQPLAPEGVLGRKPERR